MLSWVLLNACLGGVVDQVKNIARNHNNSSSFILNPSKEIHHRVVHPPEFLEEEVGVDVTYHSEDSL